MHYVTRLPMLIGVKWCVRLRDSLPKESPWLLHMCLLSHTLHNNMKPNRLQRVPAEAGRKRRRLSRRKMRFDVWWCPSQKKETRALRKQISHILYSNMWSAPPIVNWWCYDVDDGGREYVSEDAIQCHKHTNTLGGCVKVMARRIHPSRRAACVASKAVHIKRACVFLIDIDVPLLFFFFVCPDFCFFFVTRMGSLCIIFLW